MQDRTFKQAMEELPSPLSKQCYQEVQKRLDFLQHGQTIEDVTADIAEPHMRKAVREALFFVYALSLGTSLCLMDIFTRQQADELRIYLREHLAHTLTNTPSLLHLIREKQRDTNSP
jgi:hypothetical protein